MSLTVIIAHFAPEHNCDKYLTLVKRTIQSIRQQTYQGYIHITLCDDGSFWSKKLFPGLDYDEVLYLPKNEISCCEIFNGLDIDNYYALMDIHLYRGVRLKDLAIRNSMSDNIIILDDDHPLVQINTLDLFEAYLKKYHYVIGRVIGKSGKPQMYFSTNAQGTTYAFRKNTYLEIGGFSSYLFNNGLNEDNVIGYKFFLFLSKNLLKGCFAGEIYTKDLASNRWLDRSNNLSQKEVDLNQANKRKRQILFNEDFNKEFGIEFNKIHIRRNKWMDMSSINAWKSEFVLFLPWLYFYFTEIPKIIYRLWLPEPIKNIIKTFLQK
jgi:hypothetical protein